MAFSQEESSCLSRHPPHPCPSSISPPIAESESTVSSCMPSSSSSSSPPRQSQLFPGSFHTTLRHHTTQQPEPQTPTRPASLDPKEAAKFAALAASWCDPTGPFAPLHRFNPARCKFIRSAVCSARGIPHQEPLPLQGLNVLDVGCGGGILAESLARMGAQVHAIDITEENVQAARQHSLLDPMLTKRIRYECVSAEELQARGERYDVVLVSEVLEHVRRPDQFMQIMAKLMTGDGLGTATPQGQDKLPAEGEEEGGIQKAPKPAPSLLVASTLNRTVESFAVAIVGAEYLSGAVPRGTHEWEKFITPQELSMMAEQAGLELKMMAGIGWTLQGLMQLTEHTGVNYIASFGRGG